MENKVYLIPSQFQNEAKVR